MSEQTSWSRFLSGCFVLLLLAGAALGTFLHFRNSRNAQRALLEAELFLPYWKAIQDEDFEKASTFWDQQSPDKLASSYQTLESKHGKLLKASVYNAQKKWEPGQTEETHYVRCQMECVDRRLVIISYDVIQTTHGWRISQSHTQARDELGNGPF